MSKLLLYIFLNIGLLNTIKSDMTYIIDNIYLGDSVAAENEAYLEENNITAVVNTAATVKSNYIKIRSIELSIIDNNNNEKIFPKFEVGYKFVKEYNYTNILVHCHEGKSRSASFVIFYLMKEKKWDYDACITYIKERKSDIRPYYIFVEQLKDYYDKYIRNSFN